MFNLNLKTDTDCELKTGAWTPYLVMLATSLFSDVKTPVNSH